jgi:tetratricopeptide (TPR) repeat protein
MLPRDAGARARARALRHDLARAQALAQTSHYVEGYARAIDALAGARTLAHAPLVVEAQARAGNLAYQLGHFDEAELRLREAFDDSGPLAMDTLAVEVATGLAFVVGSERGRTDEGLLWVSFAARLLAQQHGPASAQADLLRARAAIYHYRGDYDQALADRVDVLDMLEASLGSEHPSVGRALQDLGETYFYRAQYELAIAHHERALMVLGRSLGEDHPALAASLVSIADAQRMHGDPHAARGLLERALAINIAALGPDHPDVANTLLSLGDLLAALDDDHAARLHLEHALAIAERERNHATAGMTLAAISSLDERAGDLDGAIRTCRRALTSTVEVLGEDHHDGGLIELQLGHLLREAGAWAEARQALEHALVLFDSQEGPELVVLLHELGRLDRAQGQHDQALAHHQRSFAIMEAYGAPGPELAEALLGVGLARLELGQPDAAVVELERALVLDGRDAISPMIRAELQFALARALRAAGARTSRARELALEAHAALDPAPIKYAALQAELDAWLADDVKKVGAP